MGKKLTKKQCEARAEAYVEAGEHLLMDWTEDSEEKEQGIIVRDQLDKLADYWFAEADRR